MKGKLNYDIARKYLKEVLKLRDAIKILRNPLISVPEMLTSLKNILFNIFSPTTSSFVSIVLLLIIYICTLTVEF